MLSCFVDVPEPHSGGSAHAKEYQLPLDTQTWGSSIQGLPGALTRGRRLPALVQPPRKPPPRRNHLPSVLLHTILPDSLPYQAGVLDIKLSGAIPQRLGSPCLKYNSLHIVSTVWFLITLRSPLHR